MGERADEDVDDRCEQGERLRRGRRVVARPAVRHGPGRHLVAVAPLPRRWKRARAIEHVCSKSAGGEPDPVCHAHEAAPGAEDALPPIPRLKRRRVVEGSATPPPSPRVASPRMTPRGSRSPPGSRTVAPPPSSRRPLRRSVVPLIVAARRTTTPGRPESSPSVPAPGTDGSSAAAALGPTVAGRSSHRPHRRLQPQPAKDALSLPGQKRLAPPAEAERLPTPPTRIQPRRGRTPPPRERVVQVFARLLARAGPGAVRSARIARVEGRLHRAYSDLASLAPGRCEILKRRPKRKPVAEVNDGTVPRGVVVVCLVIGKRYRRE
jgi:hypothetical protein